MGFAPASDLYRASAPDILDEVTGQGYQRRFHPEHSLSFKRYILKPGATTIPLTFNLRHENQAWSVKRHERGAELSVDLSAGPVMAQVDCQHRLGYLRESPISLAFMTFLGLSIDEEMDVFRVINGKAKGLSGSLLDFTESKLVEGDLQAANPELYLALKLHEDKRSPWFQRLDLGGSRTTGPMRVASLRTMQKAARRFLREAHLANGDVNDLVARSVTDFWLAISQVLSDEWSNPRQHMVVKGIGVYSLMSLAGDLFRKAVAEGRSADTDYYIAILSDFLNTIDWSNNGPLKGFGGASGADAAYVLLQQVRLKSKIGYTAHG